MSPDTIWFLIMGGGVAVLGLCLGSFTTALAYRIKHGLPWAWGPDGRPVRSMCPPCGRTLRAWELVPVFSWTIQRGRCQCGKTRIPVFYPAVECITMILSMVIFLVLGLTLWLAFSLMILPFLLALILARWVI